MFSTGLPRIVNFPEGKMQLRVSRAVSDARNRDNTAANKGAL